MRKEFILSRSHGCVAVAEDFGILVDNCARGVLGRETIRCRGIAPTERERDEETIGQMTDADVTTNS